MTRVIFRGWREGLKKISLSELQVEKLGLSLRVAKENVDRLLNGQEIVFEIEDEQVAYSFYESAENLGVICAILKVPSPGRSPE